MLSLCNSQMQMFKNMAISSSEMSPVTAFIQKRKEKTLLCYKSIVCNPYLLVSWLMLELKLTVC